MNFATKCAIILTTLCIGASTLMSCSQGNQNVTASQSTDTSEDVAPLPKEVLDSDTPLASALGPDLSNTAALADQDRQIESAITNCMAIRGFEYTPRYQESIPNASTVGRVPSTAEEAAEVGYGFVDGILSTPPAKVEDPNDARLAQMSEPEKTAWQDALFGVPLENEDQEPTDEEEGCITKALFNSDENTLALETELVSAVEAMEGLIEADQRIIDANRSWSECMVTEGFDFSDPQSAVASVSGHFMEATGISLGADLSNLTIDQESLADVSTYEKEVATADVKCRSGVDEIYRQVRREYELEVLSQHGDAVAAIRAQSSTSN